MKFTKMHGCGNDYVYVDCTRSELDDPAKVAKIVSDRHFGVGADGLICICASGCADFRMAMYNADGSEGAMCGNGIRCVAKFVYDKGLTGKTTITVETKSGIKTLELTVGEDGKVSKVTVDMGMPHMAAASIPGAARGEDVVGRPVAQAGHTWNMTCVSMGNPHAVVFVDRVDTLPLETLGPQFEHCRHFPDRVNTEFVHVVDDHTLDMRVWERGSGETLACGTGACASAVAAYLNKKTGPDVLVRLTGGDLEINLGEDGHIYMTGPATTVFEGEMEL